ncbi:sensor histidine kinase [Halobellus rufus]|uniref:sensor histidine kinase n=1 Tax=Halobellus rufus TaxID=1448860 RepID=UPI00067997B0|nr:HAMP domain-containing sensor histidine kinase [Halobellus rufus]
MTGDDSRAICGSADSGIFDYLPVLTVRTRVDDDGTQRIDGCNDQFARRLGYARADLTGVPVAAVYASDATPPSVDPVDGIDAPVPSRESPTEPTADSHADGDEPGPTSASADRQGLARPPGTPDLSDGSRDRRDLGPFEADARTAGRGPRPESAFAAAEPESVPAMRAVDCPENAVSTLVGRDGHLIQTVAESLPRDDETDGRVIFHVDLTRRERREQQANVLNRVMRHNVRNDLNLLRGHAKVLKSHGDDEVVDSAEVLDRLADRWLGLAETVRNIERLFDGVPTETAKLEDVVASARRTVERESACGRVETDPDVDPTWHVSERLHVALVELCENGIKHADAPDEGDGPVVRVEIEPSHVPGWILIHVVDEGPGIPKQELTALHAAEETPLLHGSGLGFWLVRFVVRRLGGDVAAENRDGGGGVVTLHVPLAIEDE